MENSLMAAQVLFAIIYIIGASVLREFIISKNGLLRKIMIAYFSVEVYTYAGSAAYFLFLRNVLPIGYFLIIILLPKVFVKLWLNWYLRNGRMNKDK